MRTPLGVGSLVLLHDHARPKSSEAYKLPALSATAIDEPFAAMQPVSTIRSVQAGETWRLESSMRKSFVLGLHGEWSESADECINLLAIVERSATCPESQLLPRSNVVHYCDGEQDSRNVLK
jgi:hypothetical protein